MEKVNLLSPKDLDISYFIGSGAGGQNKQKNHTGVQLIHRDSGAIGRCSDTRSREQNKKLAFERLIAAPKMKLWINKRLWEIQHETTMEQAVEDSLRPENLRVDVKENGKWVAEIKNEKTTPPISPVTL